MNFTTQISVKSALRFALPCLASCVLLSACSSEGPEMNPDNVNPTAPGSIRFTASAPLASEAKTTRIGIDGANKPDVTDDNDWDSDEPVIWLEGDAVSVFFVPTAGGNPIHAKFVVEDESISNGGKSAELVSDSDFDPSALDGEYTIYAFSPYASTNSLNNMTLDLSSQTQSVNADATNYSHLGNTAYMRANAGNATFANGRLTDGDVNLAFEHITSFLRFHIKNSLGEPINVTDISISHANLSETGVYSVETGSLTSNSLNSTINLSFSGSGNPLSKNAGFDAYMSTFPVNISAVSSKLDLTVSYNVGVETSTVTYEISQGNLADLVATEFLFEKSSRFLFNIVLSAPDPAKDFLDDLNYNGYTYNPIRWEKFLISPARFLCDQLPNRTVDGKQYCDCSTGVTNLCPRGWSLFTYVYGTPHPDLWVFGFADYIGLAPGRLNVQNMEVHNAESVFMPSISDFEGVKGATWGRWWFDRQGILNGLEVEGNFDVYFYDPRCIRAI